MPLRDPDKRREYQREYRARRREESIYWVGYSPSTDSQYGDQALKDTWEQEEHRLAAEAQLAARERAAREMVTRQPVQPVGSYIPDWSIVKPLESQLG